ncbi:MAG: MBOAT family protein [Planctomycetota bacterium]
MLFTSGIFLQYFLPLFLAIYFASPARYRAWVIAAFSYVFYGWWRPDFVLLMWVSTVVDFNCGKRIERDRDAGGSGKRWVWLSCVANLGLLAYFKYANFGIDTLNAILAKADVGPVQWTEIILPVGISFYTFQTLSYTVDVYRRQAEPVKSFRDFACYVSMFPQLVAGPIVRYRSVAEQLHSRTHTLRKFATGVMVFQAGFAKKLLVADQLAPIANAAFGAESLSMLDAWTGALAYTLQIYFDFSGYSDMAIGLGLMIGFRFPINFDRPYISRSITEFWRRWHISLSSFLRDYLYIPLGGNRKGPIRTYVNLGLTMLLGGLWHGAAWNFVAWGAYQGFWLIVERLSGKRSFYAFLPSALQMAITFVIVIFGWVLFRAPSLGDAVHYAGVMLGMGGRGADARLPVSDTSLFIFGAASLLVWFAPTTQALAKRRPLWWAFALQLLFVVALFVLHDSMNVPFLYFQF